MNKFVMKCIEYIFYLIFSTESNQKKNVCIFSCECPLNPNCQFSAAIFDNLERMFYDRMLLCCYACHHHDTSQ